VAVSVGNVKILPAKTFVIEEENGRPEVEGVIGLSVWTGEIVANMLGHTVIIFKWLFSNHSGIINILQYLYLSICLFNIVLILFNTMLVAFLTYDY
jgi:hypothetical protein